MSTRQRQDKATADKHLHILRTLLRDPHNRKCADCSNKDPRWASWNLGVFVCIRCSGVHRSMGTHISRVKSVDLDMWTPEQIQCMLKWGNRLANMYWQAHLKPGHVVPDHRIESFIRSKYDGRKWARNGPLPSDPRMLETGSGGTSASVNNPITQIQKGVSAGSAPRKAPTQDHSQSSLIDIAPAPKSLPKVQINTRQITKPAGKSGKSGATTTNTTTTTSTTTTANDTAPHNGLLDLDMTATSPTNTVKKANKQDIMSLFAKPPSNSKPVQPQTNDMSDPFSSLNLGAGSRSQPQSTTQSQSSDALSALWGTNTASTLTNTANSFDLLGGSGSGFGGAPVAQAQMQTNTNTHAPPRASTAPIPPQKNLLDDDDWGPTTSADDSNAEAFDAFDDWGSSSWAAPPPNPTKSYKAQTVDSKNRPGKIELTNNFSAPPPQPTTSLSFNTSNTTSFNDFFSSSRTSNINLNDSGYSDTSSKFSSGSPFADIPSNLNDIPAPSKLTSDPFSAFQSTSGGSIDVSSPKKKSGNAVSGDLFAADNAWSTPDPIPSPEAEPDINIKTDTDSHEKDVWSTPDPIPMSDSETKAEPVVSTPSLFDGAGALEANPATSPPPSALPSQSMHPSSSNTKSHSGDLWDSFGASSLPSPKVPANDSLGLDGDVWSAPAPAHDPTSLTAHTSLTAASSPAPTSAPQVDDIWSVSANKPPTPPSSAPPPANPTSLDDVMGNVWA
ncbi:hypothetical protein J056_002930 [Wallemia ichthyophaga EXF-994]|uniref:Arf-GAP domain-containing protein n=1 Tax=Wallemia ichthyophaga (strain EXF-994 / CBS 113033) TaxID=1299270 RepID=R9AUL7_WALI9|nr:uncharacterized protein J056_002930 [Wallemia ichthyophaga EXF-994]EOR03761.1 hypothetical protein J056_002930 [Wallemia ichthyophaga EXF-994]TIA95314.1 hypothetical protein E3P95_03770 [Wallemia ichthyophaga]TIA96272.1 hypothetical protein E3P94_03759 [Wallemia ichthyophaga]